MKTLLCGIFLLFATTAVAGDFTFGFVEGTQVQDITGYLRDFHGDAEARVGVGVSSPIVNAHYKTTLLFDAGVCGVGTAAVSGETNFSSGIGTCLNVKGLRLGVLYDPIEGKPIWMIGLSLTGAADQLLK